MSSPEDRFQTLSDKYWYPDQDSGFSSVGIKPPFSRLPQSGGDINVSSLVVDSRGTKFFLKENRNTDPKHFLGEIDGLLAIRKVLSKIGDNSLKLRAPEPLAGGLGPRGSWFLLEYIEPLLGTPDKDQWFSAGVGLANFHRQSPGDTLDFGHDLDNLIGSSPQLNTPYTSWVDFFLNQRLLPQIRMAEKAGLLNNPLSLRLKAVVEVCPTILPSYPEVSLVHGDLWAGNLIFDSPGRAVLIDPAVYRGHGEVDVAMTRMFGGFTPEFYRGYGSVHPLAVGWDIRESVYNLYHMLNHVNIFGAGYLSGVNSLVTRILSA